MADGTLPTPDLLHSRTAVSDPKTWNWQQFQMFYHMLTGKKENLRKFFTLPLQLTFSDVEDLHFKIQQTAQPYMRKAETENITVAYSDGGTLQYSSFDRFKSQASIGNTAVKSVEIEYNIAIQGSETNEFGSYKIVVRIFSGVAIFKDIQKDVPKVFWQSMGFRTGSIRVEFVDYAIAQNFFNVISQWFETRPVAPPKKVFDWIQAKSEHIPVAAGLLAVILGICFVTAPLIAHSLLIRDNNQLAEVLILAVGGIWLFSQLAYLIGATIENAIDQIWKVAYIELNEGDRRLIRSTKEHNESCWSRIIWRGVCYATVMVTSASIQMVLRALLQ